MRFLMRRNRGRLLVVLVLCVSFMAGASFASASNMNYYVVGHDASAVPEDYWINGVAGTNYVMQFPSGVPAGHVSSVYVWREPNGYHMAEGGWVADVVRDGGYPHFFSAWSKYGQYNNHVHGRATKGTYPRFSVRPGSSTFVWEWLIDGTEVWDETLNFTIGFPLASSERSSLSDSNYSDFSDLKKKSRVSGLWYEWKDLEDLTDYTNDPGYHLQKNSNTACSMVVN
jgi:hypothetical protein